MELKETLLEKQTVYEGKIVNLRRDTVRLPDGRESLRELVEHPGGVGVLPLDGDQNVYMVRQFRYGAGQVVLEIPAGKLEGEDPLDCGKRELHEEIGLKAQRYTDLGRIFPTPAYDSEIIYVYLAEGLEMIDQKLDDGEFLEVEKIPLQKLLEMALAGELPDAKTQIAVLRTAKLKGLL